MYADLHCDTFYKCFTESLDFSSERLHINSENIKGIRPYIQTFAHYIPENVPNKFEFFQRMLENTFSILEKSDDFIIYKNSSDFEKAENEKKILVVLSVEGGSFFEKDALDRISFLEKNHVRFISLCYNNGSDLCSGALSKYDTGFSRHGIEIAYKLCERGIKTDLSHLSAKSAWDAVLADLDCIATHSNCKAICNHPRNLEDRTIEKLIENKSLIGLNLYRPFVGNSIANHINHILSLGGTDSLALGCDFDGCDEFSDGVLSLSDIPGLLSRMSPRKNVWYDNVKKYFLK
ncbi:MAG: membrane dipeptidase [Clostridia bacterium]|nr:membrane dipeptidase [Clostridia bacterium]